MKRIFWSGILFTLFLGLVLQFGCAPKKPGSLGATDEIMLVAEDADWELMKNELATVFEKEVETPRPEKIFVLNHISGEEFADYNLRRNLVFVGTLQSTGKTIELIKQMIPPADLVKVEQGQSYFFQKKDPLAYNQMLLVLVANNPENLKLKILANREMLFNIFDDRLNQFTKAEVYAEAEQRVLEKSLLDKFGWSLRIQHDYKIFEENPDSQYVLLLRDYPKRWLCVAWHNTDNPSLLTPEWCMKFRNQIYAYMSGQEVIDEKHTRADTVEFYKQRAVKLVGLYGGEFADGWPKIYGGPFTSYFFYMPDIGRIYMVDYALFAPDREKKMLLRQLDIITHTFYIQNAVQKKTDSNK